MRLLLVLLTENSVSRTAELLGQTQPTVSAALKRLRGIAGDPLLVRSGSHLVPTERALELRQVVARILGDIDSNLVSAPVFDPRTTDRRFRVFAANSLGALFLPRFIGHVQRLAPAASVDLSPLPCDGDFVSRFEKGDLDLAIVNEPLQPGQLRLAPLLTTELVCLVGQHHPLARQRSISLGEYLALDHITPTPSPMSGVGPIDSKLHDLGLTRRIAFWAPEFGVIPFVLAQSSLMFTTGRPFAEHLAAIMPFAVIDAPRELGHMKFQMLWHDRQHRSPANRWLRDVVRKVIAEISAINSVDRANATLVTP